MLFVSRCLTALAVPALLASISVACDKKAPDSAEAAPAANTDKPEAPAPAIVEGYDNVRAALADDDLPRTKTAAAAYKVTVAAEAADAPGMTAGLDAIAAATELEAARDGFSTLSEGYIKFLTAHPELKTGLIAYRCPMARGYKKWVQREKKMMNPYMGKSMLECGGDTELAP